MRVVVNKKSGIGEIVAAVYYKSPAMPLDVPNLWNTLDSTSQIRLKSTNPSAKAPAIAQEIRYDAGELGVDYRFFEYGLQYFPNPEGYLPGISKDMADALFRNSSGDWIGTGEFKNIGKYIIPGNSTQSGPSGLKFFGSFRTLTQEVYAFPADSGVSKIELYDTTIKPDAISEFYDYDLGYRSVEAIPAISIYLGCSGDIGNTPRWSANILNESSEYSIGDVQKDIDLDYSLYSERFDKKVVFLTLGQRKEKSLQISYNAWIKLYNPLRNKPGYDVLVSEKDDDPEQTGETIEGLKVDLASGSLLGAPDDRPKPILSEKLGKLKPSLYSLGHQYSPWKRYRAGEIAVYNQRKWVSLCSDNYGNIPGYSSKWILNTRATDFYTSWFIVNCPKAQEIDPGIKVNVPDYQKESVFSIYPAPGYVPDDSSVNKLKEDEAIDRVIMTENIDVDEKRYYMFYVKWNQAEKDGGAIRGRVLNLSLEPKALSPTIRIPYIYIQKDPKTEYSCSWNNKLESFDLKMEGKDIVIDCPLDASIFDVVHQQVTPGTGLSKEQANEAFHLFREKLKFSVEFVKSIPGKEWTSDDLSEDEPRPCVNMVSSGGVLSDIVLHEDLVDYENCRYTLIPSWDYRKITISNSCDFEIEYPVLDVIRTETYRSGVYSPSGLVPSELMIKYRVDSDTWSEWNHVPFRTSDYKATWAVPGSGGNRNVISLTKSSQGQGLYDLQVNEVTIDLIIDIKV